MRIDHAVLCAVLALASAAASAKETVKIAFVGPLTGGNSAIGLGGRNSADLAVKLRNQDPGFGDTIRNSQCQACDSLMSERSLVMQLAGPMHAAMSPSGELAAAVASRFVWNLKWPQLPADFDSPYSMPA